MCGKKKNSFMTLSQIISININFPFELADYNGLVDDGFPGETVCHDLSGQEKASLTEAR